MSRREVVVPHAIGMYSCCGMPNVLVKGVGMEFWLRVKDCYMCSSYHVNQFKFLISLGGDLQLLFLSKDPDTIHLITYCLYPGNDLRSAE